MYYHPVDSVKTSLNSINSNLRKLAVWYQQNKWSLNLFKTKAMVFIRKCNRLWGDISSITINNHQIEIVDHFKILGVIFDTILNWKYHINSVAWKVSSAIGILSRASRFLSYGWLLMLYNLFLLPFLNYCCTIWGSVPRTTLWRLEILQKRALKVILGMLQCTQSNNVYARTIVLTTGEICDLQSLILMYDYVNGLLQLGLSGIFTFLSGMLHKICKTIEYTEIIYTLWPNSLE